MVRLTLSQESPSMVCFTLAFLSRKLSKISSRKIPGHMSFPRESLGKILLFDLIPLFPSQYFHNLNRMKRVCFLFIVYKNYNLLKMSFLSHTRRTAQGDEKKNTRLPKLTIQEQIENNEVIERMNRKITYTKNQRHLTKTLPFVEALQSTSKTNASVFRIEPEQLLFSDF